MKIVVGLGNPGREYKLTRHNLGFRVVDRLVKENAFSFSRKKFKSKIASGTIAGKRIVLAKPQTFMNASGEAVGPLVHFYQCPPADLLVVYDDVDLPFGKIRLRPGGGAGGHKGMRSIISHLGTEEFPRLRIGIRGETHTNDLRSYVLKGFTSEEKAKLEAILTTACNAVEAVIAGSFDEAMNRFN